MVQNPDKPSKYGTMARKGARISWIMGKWHKLTGL